MRFKNSASYIVGIVAVYCVYLGVTKNLDYYIHPRYELFSVIMSAICLALLVISVLASNREEHKKAHDHRDSVLVYIPVVVIIVMALVLPARSLRSSTFAQRFVDVQSGGGVSIETSRSVFSGSSRSLGIVDWAQLLSSNTDAGYYQNKPAKISGFIYDADLGTDTVWVARFAVTCCAVDARPVGVPVHVQNWQESYSQDDWVEVEGEFTLSDTKKGAQLALTPTTIKAIEEPQNPYVN